jgi:PAS domain S-box-containing protein
MYSLEEIIAQLSPTLNSLPNPVALNRQAFDRNGNSYDEVVFLNSAFFEQIGYTLEDIPDEFAWFKAAFPSSDYLEKVKDSWHNLLEKATKRDETTITLTSKILCKNQQTQWFNITTQTTHTIHEKYRTIVFIATTSPERNKRHLDSVNIKLEQKQSILKTIIDTVPIRIFWKDCELNYLGCNQIFANDVGLSDPKHLIGKSDYTLSWREHAELYRADDLEVIQTGEAKLNYEEEQTTPTGKKIWLMTSKVPLRDNEGEIFGILGSYFDITQRKENAQQLIALNQNLEEKIEQATKKRVEQEKILIQQNKMATVGEMIANIAHQWRQPLNALSILIQDIPEEYEANEMTEQYINEHTALMLKSVHYMSQTIDDFKDFFQPNRPKMQFSIKDAIDNAIVLASASLKEKEINLITHLDDSLHIEGYFNELTQVLLNIINNAKDALLQNKIKNREITIGIQKVDNCIEITLCDNAGGIPESLLSQIFNPYFTTKTESNGTGLGLYMSKMIIEQSMGGTLRAKNGNKGAHFTISFPCK